MQEHRIRRTSTNSVDSVDMENFVDVDIKQHTKVFPFPDVSDTIDQMEQFDVERANCTDYRLILTINPYCSNVLFNAVSEIVLNEGTSDPAKLKIASDKGVIDSSNGNVINRLEPDGYTIRGKDQKVTNTDMVRNTEYENAGFIYHCGYDIFNNHILRNKTFKLVNPITNKSYSHRNTRGADKRNVKNNFNTIRDFMRYADGGEVTLKRRTDVNTIEGSKNKSQENARHLYMRDDVLTYYDSINTNLTEQNGWFGFYNKSAIASSEFNSQTNVWEDMKISKVFNGNDKLACGFIEMYPDSSLYSFNPKYNEFQNREEQNWEICITYPYENDKEKVLVNGQLENGDDINALLLADYKQTIGTSGQEIVLFRSYVKHNLKSGDKIKLFYSEKTEDATSNFIEIDGLLFTVANTGDLQSENLDYYFYINDVNDILTALDVDTLEDNYTFRFVKVVNDKNCEYYYRKFRKLPNFRLKKEELTDEITKDNEKLETFIKNNCCREYVNNNGTVISYDEYITRTEETQKRYNGREIPFQCEQYPLAFAKTIYSDDITQVVFTDSIDIDKLRDNLGRPLTELFLTIVKTNKGHELWYNKTKDENDLKEIEYSHCFGDVISGLDIHAENKDSDEIKMNRIILGDVKCLFNGILYRTVQNDDDTETEEEFLKLKEHCSLSPEGIDINTNIFYGDVVELNLDNITETVLSDVYFRFNTEQREHEFNPDNNKEFEFGKLIYDEIQTDDYDNDNFECIEFEAGTDDKTTIIPGIWYNNNGATYRPEGYYYKAHYPIKVREFGNLRQGFYKEIVNVSCRPVQMNGLFIEVSSLMRSGVTSGDTVYLCDSASGNIIMDLVVNSVQDMNTFVLSQPYLSPDDEGYLSIYNIIEGLLHSEAHTITSEDIKGGYEWTDERGLRHIANGNVEEGGTIVIPTDEGKVVYDYSKPVYTLKLKNNDVSDYAYKINDTTFVWRDILTVGNKDAVNLPEYPFANGHFYINKEIDFFLKRQDPFGKNKLYSEFKTPNDIYGNVKEDSIYEYKDETNVVC